jgi:hypothetical protein
MHTKEEITKKKAQSSEQLDLVETISSESKASKKRLFVIIAICATIGLSLIFWVYSFVKNLNFTLPSVPSITISPSSPLPLDTQLKAVLGVNYSQWNIDIKTDSDIVADLHKLKISSDSLVKDVLPQGLNIKEYFLSSGTEQSLETLITVPEKQIYITLKHTGSDLNYFKSTVSRLIPVIYWATILIPTT